MELAKPGFECSKPYEIGVCGTPLSEIEVCVVTNLSFILI